MLAVSVGGNGAVQVRPVFRQIAESGLERGALAKIDVMAQQGDLGKLVRPLKGELMLRAAAVVDKDDIREARVYQAVYHGVELVGGIERGKDHSAIYGICYRFVHKFDLAFSC